MISFSRDLAKNVGLIECEGFFLVGLPFFSRTVARLFLKILTPLSRISPKYR